MNRIKAWFRLMKYNRIKRKNTILTAAQVDEFEIPSFDHSPFISNMDEGM